MGLKASIGTTFISASLFGTALILIGCDGTEVSTQKKDNHKSLLQQVIQSNRDGLPIADHQERCRNTDQSDDCIDRIID
jgi:hypothetical protein